MVNGKYAALSGAVARMRTLDNISERLASANTPGYKKGTEAFSARLGEAVSGMATNGTNFTSLTGQKIDFSLGHMEYTGLRLDVAINGEGFFQMQQPGGESVYTRVGSFKLSPEGQLIGNHEYPVMDVNEEPIFLPNADVMIRSDGTIWEDGAAEPIAQIALYVFEDKDILRRGGNGMFVTADDTEPELHPQPEMIQNNIESSNVNMMEEMTRMTTNMRAFEATQKALRIYSDMNAKASELGLVQ